MPQKPRSAILSSAGRAMVQSSSPAAGGGRFMLSSSLAAFTACCRTCICESSHLADRQARSCLSVQANQCLGKIRTNKLQKPDQSEIFFRTQNLTKGGGVVCCSLKTHSLLLKTVLLARVLKSSPSKQAPLTHHDSLRFPVSKARPQHKSEGTRTIKYTGWY